MLHKFGVTRRVTIEEGYNWVTKQPYQFDEDGYVYFDSIEESVDFEESSMYDDECDGSGEEYNAREIEIYEQYGKQYDCLAAIRPDSTREELYMECIEGTVDDYDEHYNDSVSNFTRKQFDGDSVGGLNIIYLMSGVLGYNKNAATPVTLREIHRFLEQIKELDEEINITQDLHSNNLGFKNGKIKVIDYAGFSWD